MGEEVRGPSACLLCPLVIGKRKGVVPLSFPTCSKGNDRMRELANGPHSELSLSIVRQTRGHGQEYGRLAGTRPR